MSGYALDALPPGCVNNASTFNFPVLYKVVEGYSSTQRGEGGEFYPPCLLDMMIGAAKELETQGVRAITGGCGFFSHFQKGVAAAVNVPVFLSSLRQIPITMRKDFLKGD